MGVVCQPQAACRGGLTARTGECLVYSANNPAASGGRTLAEVHRTMYRAWRIAFPRFLTQGGFCLVMAGGLVSDNELFVCNLEVALQF